jgi:hypothetical protein
MKRYLHADRYVMSDREAETSWYRIRAELRSGQTGRVTTTPSAAPRPSLVVAAALSVCAVLLASHLGTQRLIDGGLPADEVSFDGTRGSDAAHAPAPLAAPAEDAAHEGAVTESAKPLQRALDATPDQPATLAAAPMAKNAAKGWALDAESMETPDPLRLVESWLDRGQLPPPGSVPAADFIEAVAAEPPTPAETGPAITSDFGPSPLTPDRRLLRLRFAAPAAQDPTPPSATPQAGAVVIFDPATVVRWRPLGAPLRASVRGFDPDLRDVPRDRPAVALYELELRSDAAPDAVVATARLTRPAPATGPVAPDEILAEERLPVGLFRAAGDDPTPLSWQAVAAEFARACNVGGPEVGSALAALLPQAELLAARTDGDANAQRLLAVVRRAAELAAPAQPDPPIPPRR